jgi:hypothetical protein
MLVASGSSGPLPCYCVGSGLLISPIVRERMLDASHGMPRRRGRSLLETTMPLKAKDPKKAKLKKPKILIFGPPGVGKTWGALDFPRVYYIDCEGGATLDHYTDKLKASGGVYLGPEDGANDFDVVLDQVKALATSKHPYGTLVLDSYSKLYSTRIAEQFEVMEGKQNFDPDKTFGREKKPAISKTRQMIAWFDRLDMNAILICHQKDVWADGKVVGHTFDGYEKLEYELDLVLQIQKVGQARKAKVGKCRLKQFREQEVFDWNYTTFATKYGKEVIEAASVPVEPASAEQIRVIEQLSSIVRLDDEIRVKWFEKAGVDAWGEMDATTIQTCIDHLKSKLPQAAVA